MRTGMMVRHHTHKNEAEHRRQGTDSYFFCVTCCHCLQFGLWISIVLVRLAAYGSFTLFGAITVTVYPLLVLVATLS
jgi:hypothetical protein